MYMYIYIYIYMYMYIYRIYKKKTEGAPILGFRASFQKTCFFDLSEAPQGAPILGFRASFQTNVFSPYIFAGLNFMFLKNSARRESWRRAATAILLGIAFQDLVVTKNVSFW